MRHRRSVAGLVVSLLVVSGCGGQDKPQPPVLPDVMAAIGDSITTAAVPGFDRLAARNDDVSWATGGEAVRSHSARLIDLHPPLEGRVTNHAVPGARMSDAPAQAERAVADGAEYVTFLFGANDVCAMTPVAAFEADLRRALGRLADGPPDAEVFVVTIPDIGRLRDLFGGDPRAQAIWDRAGICRPVLGSAVSDEERQAAAARREEFNRLLQDVCDGHANCRHDGGAVAGRAFGRDEVSPVDRFHPSVEGQRRLAEITWRAWLDRG